MALRASICWSRRVAAAREKVGPDADLMLNIVMGYHVDYAIRVIERLRPYRLRWGEEPLMPPDTKGLRAIKQAAPATSPSLIPVPPSSPEGRNVQGLMRRHYRRSRACAPIGSWQAASLRRMGGGLERLELHFELAAYKRFA